MLSEWLALAAPPTGEPPSPIRPLYVRWWPLAAVLVALVAAGVLT